MIKIETKKRILQTFDLVKKTLYKTVEFQLLFKAVYIGFFFFVLNLFLGLFFNISNLILEKLRLGETLENIRIITLLNIQPIVILIFSLFIISYIHLVEKNGLIIITSEYYKNFFPSFFSTILKAFWKTPQLILQRVLDMKRSLVILITIYIVSVLISLFNVPDWASLVFSSILSLYGIKLFFSLLFQNNFKSYTILTEDKKDPIKFKVKDIAPRRRPSIIIFYALFSTLIVGWILSFYVITKILFYLSTAYPNFISLAIAIFIAFTIISLIVFFSILQTFKISLLTILYFEERKNQKKPVKINKKYHQPLLSKNLKASLVAILIIISLTGTLITSSIKIKTDQLINNANDYIKQIKREELEELSPENINPKKILENAISQENNTIKTVENIIFVYLAYLIIN